MAFTDSMFLFELVVEELKSYTKCKVFSIITEFANVFTIHLRDPNLRPSAFRIKRTQKVRNGKAVGQRSSTEPKVETGQSILFESDIGTLISNMKLHPMELSLYSKEEPEFKIGTTQIPWSCLYIDYLNKLSEGEEPPPVMVSGKHKVFNEYTSRRMAFVKLNIKLSHIKNKIGVPFNPLLEEYKKAFMHSCYNTEKTPVNNTKDDQADIDETGTIRTIYSGGKRKLKPNGNKRKQKKKEKKVSDSDVKEIEKVKSLTETEIVKEIDIADKNSKIRRSIVSFVRSDTDLDSFTKQITLIRSKSFSSIDYNYKERLDTLSHIFSDYTGPFGNQVYYVGYFTVENEFSKDNPSPKSSATPVAASDGASPAAVDSEKTVPSSTYYKFQLCDSDCQNQSGVVCTTSICSLDLPEQATRLIKVDKCKQIDCSYKRFQEPQTPPDERILIDFTQMNKECCKVEKVEKMVGGVQAKMTVGKDPCYCSCECTFGFIKKTTYCNICGGYEIVGDEVKPQKQGFPPYPCPIFHKANKLRTSGTSGSDIKKKLDDSAVKSPKATKSKTGSDNKKSIESEKDTKDKDKKGKKKTVKEDDRFKFNYGYQAPHIGHSQCGFPCTGTIGQVPKHMGWLWTADNVPGLKFRPNWKPGATHKHVVRLLKIARYPEQVLAKKRKKDVGKKKRPLKRPLLVVQKKDGEYIVTMETMKQFNKPRAINQAPYEDKDPVTFTIGRTDEENRIRQKKKERKARRLEREQRDFIQNTFRDMCQEICMKTYRQALGLLPHSEDPECTCFPAEPGADKVDLEHSCSCTDTLSSLGSDTDDDEWLVEFTPPTAFFDQSYKGKKVHTADNQTQYTYLDYKVKLLDRYGNPVPRFFTGPDGKKQCSDLGGFWSPDHRHWLEINIDGFVGPDERWAPHLFIGPSGEQVDAETGKFQTTTGEWLVVGVDGYVDSQGKWKFYSRPKTDKKRIWKKKAPGEKKQKDSVKSEGTWSCFGDATPKHLSHMGIVGHGHDRKLLLSTLEHMLAKGEDVKLPQPSTVPRLVRRKPKKKLHQASHTSRILHGHTSQMTYNPTSHHNMMHGQTSRMMHPDKLKCKHATPSTKGVLAVDERGRKTYFTVTDFSHQRPKERMAALGSQGISLSSFHVPCLSSFINSEVMRQQQYEHILEHNARVMRDAVGQTDKPY